MAESDIIERFARLEALLEKGAEDERRQFNHVNELVARVRGSLVQLETRIADVEQQQRKTTDVAANAVRRANDSLHEIQGVSSGLMAHLSRIDDARKAEASASEEMRRKSAGAHAQRFEDQGRAIDQLQKLVVSASKRQDRSRWWLALVISLVTVVGNQVVEAIKAFKAPTTTIEAPR